MAYAIGLHVVIAFGRKDSSFARWRNFSEHHQFDRGTIFVYKDKILGVWIFLCDEVVGLESGTCKSLQALKIKMLYKIFIECFFSNFGITQRVLT